MDCHSAQELLPFYAIGALSDDEIRPIEQHLQDGCVHCQKEFEELLAASSLLAESLTPVTPRPALKHELLAQIEEELSSPNLATAADIHDLQKPRWLSYLPYVAATICAILAGSWAASTSSSSAKFTDQQKVALDQQARQKWQQKMAAVTRTFDDSKVRIVNFESAPQNHFLNVAIFHDQLASQLHVVATGVPAPTENQQVWLWILDKDDQPVVQGQLKYLGQGNAAGLLSYADQNSTATMSISYMLITNETPGPHTTPSNSVIGKVTPQQSSQP